MAVMSDFSQFIIALVLTVAGFVIMTVSGYFAKDRWDSIRKKRNVEMTATNTRPARSTRFSVTPSKFTIVAGTQRMTVRADQLQQPFSVADLNGVRPFSAHLSGGKLYIDADIYAGKHREAIKLRENKLTATPENWDTNFNDSALEIVNHHGEPVFQLEYLGENSASIKGIFDGGAGGMPGVRGIFVCDDSGWMATRYTDSPPMRYSMRQLFKYPSDKFPGERDTAGKANVDDADKSFTKPTAHEIYENLQVSGNSSPPASVAASFVGRKIKWRLLFAGKNKRPDETVLSFRPSGGYPPIDARSDPRLENSVQGLIDGSSCVVEGTIEGVESTLIRLKATSITPIELNNRQLIP